MRIFAVPMLAILAACQTAKPVQKQQTWEEFTRDHPDSFIATYRGSVDRETEDLRTIGRGADFDLVRRYVDAYLPAGDYTIRATGANAVTLRAIRVDSITNFLVRNGYGAAQFSEPATPRRMVEAAASVVGRGQGGADLVTVAPMIAAVDLVGMEELPDGSTDIVYRVAEPIKRSPTKGATIRFHMRDPQPRLQAPAPGVPPPPPPPLLGWEDADQPHQILILRPSASPSTYPWEKVVSPMPVRGDQVLPSYHSAMPETTLTILRQAAQAQICAPDFVPVSGTPVHSIPC
nr:hypothetical protein [uncultured Sphingomonas sp.]